jgi:hypothetical protein
LNQCEKARGSYAHYQLSYQKARLPVATATMELWQKGFTEAHLLQDLNDEIIRDLVLPEAGKFDIKLQCLSAILTPYACSRT